MILLSIKIFIGFRLMCSRKLDKNPYLIQGIETVTCAFYYCARNDFVLWYMFTALRNNDFWYLPVYFLTIPLSDGDFMNDRRGSRDKYELNL